MDRLIELLPKIGDATVETLIYVAFAITIGGLIGLIVGVLLTTTRRGGILQSTPTFWVLNLLVNFFRPIPFVLILMLLQPLARMVTGKGIGGPALIFSLVVAAAFGISRLVEQNLLTVPPGQIEAARAMGAGPLRIIFTVLIPEGLGPLVLGYTFAFVAIVDMSAMAGIIGAGGIGNFALQYGYRQSNPWVTWASVLIIVVIVQIAQLVGNVTARKLLRR
ncbi:methionine ABC transporter permease [Leucobacter aridicollis]|uniref:D-methionine transport system permease protein n=1 Tax=Leucobacter aridicollis TaxID=283878 RepID=A0A852R5Q0_9MICO|nr:ABC transporter permease subunit [Leucobacter aridicollis]MBL3682125.1 ABC transporter permease subunit [Leucobacter aridicollis]NYD26825.1 D-methionine transport system permease protein [Leucobacter aridicollis]